MLKQSVPVTWVMKEIPIQDAILNHQKIVIVWLKKWQGFFTFHIQIYQTLDFFPFLQVVNSK